MGSEQPSNVPRSPEERSAVRSVVYTWEGQLVALSYTTGGRYPENPTEIRSSDLRATSGVFALLEVDEIGVLAGRLLKNEEGEGQKGEKFRVSKRPVFVPWGSVNSIYPLRDVLDQ